MRNILILAYTFPPNPYGGSYRALRLSNGLMEHGVECHVVTLNIYDDIPNDFTLLEKVPEGIHIHRTHIIDPWRKYQTYKSKNKGKVWFKYINKLVSFALRFITFPDHMLLWVPFAIIKSRQVIKKYGIKEVLVTSPPHSSLLVGWFLKKTMKVNWVADLRDPIFGNVAQVHLIDPTNAIDKIEKKLLFKFDDFVAKNADVVVANTEHHSKVLKKRHPEKNITFIRNSFDSNDFVNIKKELYKEFTISHIGSIYGKRNPEPLFIALRRIIDSAAPSKLSIRIQFVGQISISLESLINKYSLSNYIRIINMVPHHEAISIMCNSQLLLLIKATGNWSAGQIPGKFFEYAGSRTKILCLGSLNSEVATLINENNLGYVVDNDIDQLTEIIQSEYKRFSQDKEVYNKFKLEDVDEFSKDVMVGKFIKLFGFKSK
jgi:glycosyltransferase involved in cell wall biosynthesis